MAKLEKVVYPLMFVLTILVFIWMTVVLYTYYPFEIASAIWSWAALGITFPFSVSLAETIKIWKKL